MTKLDAGRPWWQAGAQALAQRVDRLPPLPVPLARGRALVAAWVTRLPSEPPSALAALALNRRLWPRLGADVRDRLQAQPIGLEITDLGLRLRLRATPQGFAAAADRGPTALRIAARSSGWWRLARGLEDPDRLFFDCTLVMEGDTELGLLLKNSLDALGPLWPAQD
jgi:predicted lipid carrier protein YhbT